MKKKLVKEKFVCRNLYTFKFQVVMTILKKTFKMQKLTFALSTTMHLVSFRRKYSEIAILVSL